MPPVRESLGIVDGGPPSLTFSIKSKKGLSVSWSYGFIFAVVYLISLAITGLLVYNLISCPKVNEGHPNFSCNNSELEENLLLSMENITIVSAELLNASKKMDLRLPPSVKPIQYKISLIPFIFESNFTFIGNVEILTRAINSTTNITLHTTELLISKTEVIAVNETNPNKKNLTIVKQYNDPEKQFHIIQLQDELIIGSYYQINMDFSGKINDDLHGFYRSSYTVGNETRWLGASQFQPTDARRAFPCFDEPAMKARFTISIGHHKNFTALSNMDTIGVQDPVEGLPDYVWDHFRESLPMSTYLVCFIVSDFASKSHGNFTVWARKDAIESANYALEIGPKILSYFEKFYQIDYPLPKVDMIALPDFNAGAMENWGLITFRESTMLYDEGISAKINKPRVATIVAHELAHQWFGNLVTPSWWSDLWLNEGFASYVEYVGVDAVETTWKSMDQFVLHEIQNVFSLDALSSSHQISVEVENPDEINDIFDRISYGKGAAIIRMMSHFLTGEIFNKGITNYLNSKKYESAEQNDLWRALTEQARKDGIFDNSMSIEVIMDTWTLQTGFPVINVKRNYMNRSMTVQQERFLLINDKNQSNLNEKTPVWWIPITYTSKSDADFHTTKPKVWMKGEKNITIEDPQLSEFDWVIFNIRQTGFYRVNYDIENWQMIVSYLNDKENFEKISTPNRAQILDDSLNLALAGKLSYDIALHVTKYLVHEREFIPWKAGIIGLGYIDAMMSKTPRYLEYKKYIISLIKGVYNEVGFTDHLEDPMLTVYKRIDITNIACLMEHEDCVREAVTQFRNWMLTPNPDTHNPISPNLRNTVYCTAARVGGETEWHFMKARFENAHSVSEKELLMIALGCTRLPWLLTRYLDLACRNDSGIRKQDVYRVFAAVSNSVIGQPIGFSFIRENWNKLKNYLASPSILNSIVKYSTRKLNTQHELEELKKFASARRSELGRTIDQAIEKTEANIIWMKNNYEIIVNWLNYNLS